MKFFIIPVLLVYIQISKKKLFQVVLFVRPVGGLANYLDKMSW